MPRHLYSNFLLSKFLFYFLLFNYLYYIYILDKFRKPASSSAEIFSSGGGLRLKFERANSGVTKNIADYNNFFFRTKWVTKVY